MCIRFVLEDTQAEIQRVTFFSMFSTFKVLAMNMISVEEIIKIISMENLLQECFCLMVHISPPRV